MHESMDDKTHMDKQTRKKLKNWGKSEVERQSAEINARLTAANPADISSEQWIKNYRTGTEREIWLRKNTPVLSPEQLNRLFIVSENMSGSYAQCGYCYYALPLTRELDVGQDIQCQCGNFVIWRSDEGYHFECQQPDSVRTIRLLGRGE